MRQLRLNHADSMSGVGSTSARESAPILVSETVVEDDAVLVAKVRTGDPAAFEVLFRGYADAMGQIAYQYLRSVPDAEDAVMQVFHKIWTQHHRWAPRGPLAIYLRAATRYQALNMIRSTRNAARHEMQAVDDGLPLAMGEAPVSQEAGIAVAELTTALLNAAELLPKRQRAVFLLKWRDGVANADIAARLGVSAKAVEVHLTRAMRVVRARIRKYL